MSTKTQLELKPVPLDGLERFQRLCIQTFTEAFSAVNTKANMNAYLMAAFNLQRLEREITNAASQFFYCQKGDETIGYMKLNLAPAQSDINDPETLELERIYVLRDHQNKKAGMFMIRNAIEFAGLHGLKAIWLGVWDQNVDAIRFYERQGFIRVSEHSFMLGDERQTDIIMERRI